MDEPTYVDEGNEFGDSDPKKPPKNRTPTTDWQRELLAVFGMKYFKDKNQKSRVRMIEKQMAPYALNPSRPPIFPTEYVKELIEWARKKRRTQLLPLDSLISAICNDARRDQWIANRVQDAYEARTKSPEPYTPTPGVVKIITKSGQEISIDECNLYPPEPTDTDA
jgi:hypothetical protein